jgi:hypothetical protein
MFIALAAIFSRFSFKLHDTDLSDVEMAHAYLLPNTKWDSKGVRVFV